MQRCTDRALLALTARPTLGSVDNRSEVRDFLTTRRARLTPERVGLPAMRSRRVPGLRRSEVASLAGLSVEYYARLERGQLAGASPSVMEALARALQLDEIERAHLYDLARAAHGIPTSGRPHRRQGRRTSQPAVGVGGDHRRRRVRPRPAAEPAHHQRARPCLVRTGDR